MLARVSTSDGFEIRGVYGEGGYDKISIFAQATRPRTISVDGVGKFLSPAASVRRVIFHEIGHRVSFNGGGEATADAFADLFE